MLNAKTSRAARGLLDWTQTQLAERAGVSLSTVRDFENENREARAANVAAMEKALRSAGIEFLNGGSPGVRLRPKRSKGKRSA